MAAKKRRKPWLKFPKRMQKKLIVMFSAIAVLLTGLIGRLMYIEYTSGDKYEKIVLSQQEYDSQTIPYQRGDIVDSKGTVLATSIAVYNVILDCSVMTSKDEYIEPTIQALASCFEDLDSNTLYGYAKDQKDSRYIVLKKKASYEEIQPFVEMQEAVDEKGKKVNPDIKGVWFEEDYLRSYPFNETACDTIGFALDRDVADIGLEGYYNSTLTGVDGRQYGYINDDSDVEQTIIAAVNGKSIQTSIDIGAQQIVEKYVNGFKEAMGAKNIGVIVENPSTGEIIAMDGGDRYDLNNPRDLSAVYTEDEINDLIKNNEFVQPIHLMGWLMVKKGVL